MVRLGSTPVLDFGTFSVKAGFAGEQYPLLVFTHETFFPWPIVRGVIEDWERFEEMMTVIWSKMRVDTSEEEVIIVEYTGARDEDDDTRGGTTTEEDHRRMEILMFEKFKVRYLTFLNAPLCVCYAAGIKTGLIVDFGHGVTRLSIVIDNEAKKQLTVPIGSQDVDADLMERLDLAFPELQHKLETQIRAIKEEHCFASLDPETDTGTDTAKCLNRTYKLPNGTPVLLNRERAACIEQIFKPVKLTDTRTCSSDSIPELMKQLLHSYPDHMDQLSENIVICGGMTQCSNFNYRLLSELYKKKAARVLRIFCPPERGYTCWVGASIIYFDNDYVDQGMSFNEYNLKYLQSEQ